MISNDSKIKFTETESFLSSSNKGSLSPRGIKKSDVSRDGSRNSIKSLSKNKDLLKNLNLKK